MEGLYLCDYRIQCKYKNSSKCEGCSYKYQITSTCKPPIGIKPKHIHDEERIRDLSSAAVRYLQARFPIPMEWIEEYNQLLEVIK